MFKWIAKHLIGGEKEYTKSLVNFVIINAEIQMYCTIILAFLGREEIADGLTKVIAAEVVGVVLAAASKALFENLSSNNTWPDKPDSEAKG